MLCFKHIYNLQTNHLHVIQNHNKLFFKNIENITVILVYRLIPFINAVANGAPIQEIANLYI